MAGLRLLSLTNNLLYSKLSFASALGPVFFLYSLSVSRQKSKFSYLFDNFSRTLLRTLLFQKSTLFVKRLDNPSERLTFGMGLPVLSSTRSPNYTTSRVPRTNLFFSFRGRRSGFCFTKRRWGFFAVRLSIPRILPWRARLFYLHHRIRWFWLRNPTTQAVRHESYTLRRQF